MFKKLFSKYVIYFIDEFINFFNSPRVCLISICNLLLSRIPLLETFRIPQYKIAVSENSLVINNSNAQISFHPISIFE